MSCYSTNGDARSQPWDGEHAKRCHHMADYQTMKDLEGFARVEAKATLRLADAIWIGTKEGLCRRTPGGHLHPHGNERAEIKALSPTPDGFLYVVKSHDQAHIVFADENGNELRRLDGPDGEKLSGACTLKGELFVTSKTGIFKQAGTKWGRVLGESGFEVTRIWSSGDHLFASVKKQGKDRLPALAESGDLGGIWTVTPMQDYGDVVVAADETRIVTRWRGGRLRQSRKDGYKKHPITAAELGASGGIVVVDGDKIEIAGPGRRKMEVFHPRVADAEHVHLLPDGLFFAGPQGAFLLDPLSGNVTDLAAGLFPGAILGKRKKVFALDNGVVVAACTFGLFRSADGGATWQPVDSEWDVLDAEHALRTAAGRWYILCQRALFRSDDNGLTWHYVKPKMPHGSRHYGEFRCIAAGGGKLWFGTKAGLFAAPLGDPERLAPDDRVERASVEGLFYDAAGDRLILASEGHGLRSLCPSSGELTELAGLTLHEASITADGSRFIAADEHALLSLDPRGKSEPFSLPGAKPPFRLATSGDAILVWSREHAWAKRTGEATWKAVEAWPKGTRSAAFAGNGRVVATDRAALTVLNA
jgi:hypothetical protein